MPKRILVYSWFYPPVNSSEGTVTYKLINNSRFQYDVFTQKERADWSFGINSELSDGDNVHTIFSKSRELDDWINEGVEFYLANKDKYDIIMTRAMPPESHKVGIRIKQVCPEVKWIASFGDPIKNSPYQHMDDFTYSKYSVHNLKNRKKGFRYLIGPKRTLKVIKWYWKRNNRQAVKIRKEQNYIEDTTLSLANEIILNNETQARFMIHTDEILKKTTILHHSFDMRLYPDPLSLRTLSSSKKRFVFIGGLNAKRTGLPLLRAINELYRKQVDLPQKAEFYFYGDMPDKDLVYIMRNHLTSFVHFESPISYLESLQEISKADWMIHIDANIGSVWDDNIFFAGKIADYFGAPGNILSISMQNGDVVDCLKKAGALTLSFSPQEICQYLYLIIYQNFHQEKNLQYIATFSSKAVAAEFDEKVLGKYVN